MKRRGPLLLLLGVHVALLAAVIGRSSPWATASIDCLVPTLGEILLSEGGWSPWDAVDTAVGGQAVAAFAALPAYAAMGTSAGVGKVLAVLLSACLVWLTWALLRPAGEGAALLGAAGLAFAPPLVVHTAMILGNWHYEQLLFDYGAALLAISLAWPQGEPLAGPRRVAGWALFGAVVGLGLVFSPGSAPFLALACALLAVGSGRRATLSGLAPAAVGLAVGGAPLWWRILAGPASSGGQDATLSRLGRMHPDLGRLPDLVYPELPWTLHVHDLASPQAVPAIFKLEVLWVVLARAGVAIAAGWAIQAARRRDVPARVVAGVAVPILFAAAFAAACVALDLKIERLPWRYTNVREHSHRVLPPLLVAMAVGAGPGWAIAWGWAGRVGSRGGRRALRSAIAVAAGFPPRRGAGARVAMGAAAPGGGAYRGPCFDVPGFSAVARRGPQEAEALCSRLSTAERRADCLSGVAWGIGYSTARVEGTAAPGDRDDPCSYVAPDLRDRCRPWRRGEVPVIAGEAPAACAALDGERRDLCFLGVGWFVSQLGPVWTAAPLGACESLATERDRDACWRGPGFAAADHLHPTPSRLADLIRELPPARRAAAARGAGYSVGRTWDAEAPALALCEGLGPDLEAPCALGVADARRRFERTP